jgi:hypothetical protein
MFLQGDRDPGWARIVDLENRALMGDKTGSLESAPLVVKVRPI